MRRPWPILILFGLCIAGVLGAMAWVTDVAVNLDRREATLALQAEREENIRLALWRMESILIPLMVQENARSYLEFSALYTPADVIEPSFATYNPVLVTSPLVTRRAEHIRLYFQVESKGQVSSPQLPTGVALASVQQIYGDLDFDGELRRSFTQLQDWGDTETLLASAPQLIATVEFKDGLLRIADANLAFNTLNQQPQYGQQAGDIKQQVDAQSKSLKQAGLKGNSFLQQSLRNSAELNQRQRVLDNTNRINIGNSEVAQGALAIQAVPLAKGDDLRFKASPVAVRQGEFLPVWHHGELMLIRRVTEGASSRLQGVWLNWPKLRDWLVGEVTDLLPEAALEPVGLAKSGEDFRVLAAAPIRLIPGQLPAVPVALSDSIRNSLALAWACALLGVVAVALLLWGIVGLSERRSDFVSSVTHELRTPLTTLQMYTELLAGGMVKDETKRAAYLDTLQREAVRLGRLIENVMAYARLERGRSANSSEQLSVDQIVERLHDRLAALTDQSGMKLSVDVDPAAHQCVLKTNSAAVEQIITNLVDNACKYAHQADDPCVELNVDATATEVRFRIIDHGPGLSPEAARRLFKPFSRSTDAVESSAPGIGLGLALCRRLARQLGGKLILDSSYKDGCCFVFTLPAEMSQGG